MIRNGVVRYDTAAPTAKVTAAVPENDTVPDSIPIQAKDTYIAGSGVCGVGFSAGANHVLLVHCQDCEEDQFFKREKPVLHGSSKMYSAGKRDLLPLRRRLAGDSMYSGGV